ncbi:MAG: hypothetical protein PHD68_02225 [Rugosibacter sp.]|nr:hypothetical protein [Rugosibacter sp.]
MYTIETAIEELQRVRMEAGELIWDMKKLSSLVAELASVMSFLATEIQKTGKNKNQVSLSAFEKYIYQTEAILDLANSALIVGGKEDLWETRLRTYSTVLKAIASNDPHEFEKARDFLKRALSYHSEREKEKT